MFRILLAIVFLLFKSNLWAQDLYQEGDILKIFLEFFQKNTNYPSAEINLEKYRIEPSTFKITKNTPLKIEWIGMPRAGSNTALFIFKSSQGENQILRVWGFIQIKTPVVIVKNNLSPKTILTKEDLCLEKRELSRLPQDVIYNIEEVLGKETKISLKAGTILRRAFVEDPIIIGRNQEVEIIARGANFEVRAKGIALQPGRLKEIIRVKNLSSQKTIQAMVVDKRKVEVIF